MIEYQYISCQAVRARHTRRAGPRIIHPSELPRFGECAHKRLSVKPGITGLWQISGRQHVSYDERVLLDMKYIDTRSCMNDFLILFRTLKVLFACTGV